MASSYADKPPADNKFMSLDILHIMKVGLTNFSDFT